MLLALLPLIGLMFLPEYSPSLRNVDFAKELQASLLEARPLPDGVEVLGLLKNVGPHAWREFSVEAEFYDDAGKFLDEASRYFMFVSVPPNTEEHFKVTLTTNNDKIVKGKPKIVVKVSEAMEARF